MGYALSASKGLSFQTSTRLVINSGKGFGLGFFVIGSHLRWFELDGQLVELAGEAERRLIVLVVHASAGIHSHVEGLVDRPESRNSVRHSFLGDFLAFNGGGARASVERG